MTEKRQRGSSIRRVQLKNGEIRWRFRVDLDAGPDGKRRQQTITCRTEEEAIKRQARARTEVAAGVYVEPDRRTVDDVLDGWLLARSLRWKPSTRAQNESALRPFRVVLGAKRVQQLRREDINRAVGELLQGGGRSGQGRSARTVRLATQLLSSALQLAVKDGTIARNPAADVELPRAQHHERDTWSAVELARFLELVDGDRLVGPWYLTALGMRRGEVLGARWSDVDWDKGVLRIRQARVKAGGEVVTGTPKSERSRRDVPLDQEALRALRLTRDRTLGEGTVIPLRQRGADGRVIAVDELGQPLSPDLFSKSFHRIVAAGDLPRIRLHDVRHSVATLMLEAGQPPHAVARVLGHDPAVLMSVYAHVTDRSAGAAVAALRAALGGR